MRITISFHSLCSFAKDLVVKRRAELFHCKVEVCGESLGTPGCRLQPVYSKHNAIKDSRKHNFTHELHITRQA